MAYGNYQGRSNYGNGGGYQRGGYQQQAPAQQAPQPVDINAEINARIDMFLAINEAIKARGLEPADFSFAIGGWTTSLILEQKKGR